MSSGHNRHIRSLNILNKVKELKTFPQFIICLYIIKYKTEEIFIRLSNTNC